MTEQEQRIAIAEACGWKKVRINSKWSGSFDAWVRDGEQETELPDYFRDLNAMHEVEKTLIQTDPLLRDMFCVHLNEIIERECAGEYGGDSIEGQFWVAHATAAQRAEAFLLTIGKWKD